MATANMNLNLPVPTVTLGPQWATELNTALTLVDSHDHTSSKGVKVPAAGLNINSDLEFNGNRATEMFALQLNDNAATLTGATNARAVYSVLGDLYYTNTTGTAIQITTGGALATSPGSAQSFETKQVSTNLVISNSDTFVFLIVDTTASRNITLPLANSVSDGRIYIIKDKDGLANTNNITLTAAGSDLIDGAATQVFNTNFGSFQVVGDGVSNYYIS